MFPFADAWTALFNGSVSYLIDSFPTQETHIDNWSLRFKSPLKDALLFQTFAHNSDLFLRCSIEDGKVKVETNLGGELKVSVSTYVSKFLRLRTHQTPHKALNE